MWHLAEGLYSTQVQSDGYQFLSFAKRSKVVQRQRSDMDAEAKLSPIHSHKAEFHYMDLYQPSDLPLNTTRSYSPFQMQSFSNNPEEKTVMIAEAHLAGQIGKTRGRRSLGKLPSPAEVMGRRRKVLAGGAAQGSQTVTPRVAAVLQHICDLHKRQISIDQLKWGNWGGSRPRWKAEEEHAQMPSEDRSLPHAQLESSQEEFSTIAESANATTGSLSLNLTHPYSQPHGHFGGFEHASLLARRGIPVMSFVLATADREPTGGQAPCLSHNEFWGIGHAAEE
ncbi:hypothetical protein UPYG_G00117150 [Umbra pygmaea]|uniref:Uncharacterized protein n=1 Tax=Umbra pygmaea TaxID=75934 RepID=A0ABD0X504_UMBPY